MLVVLTAATTIGTMGKYSGVCLVFGHVRKQSCDAVLILAEYDIYERLVIDRSTDLNLMNLTNHATLNYQTLKRDPA